MKCVFCHFEIIGDDLVYDGGDKPCHSTCLETEKICKEIELDTFKVLKSGPYKGKLSSKWFRKNNGQVVLTCPKCDGSIPGSCSCGWEKDYSGFRYRYIEIDYREKLAELENKKQSLMTELMSLPETSDQYKIYCRQVAGINDQIESVISCI